MIAATFRSATRSRAFVAPRRAVPAMARISFPQIRMYSAHDHKEETFEEFTARYEQEFEDAYDLFEVQRVLNNCFSYDLVPAPSVIQKALEACRRVNDYPTAVRTFEALKHKVENQQQYQAYLDELKDTRAELGIDLKEELYSEA
ncbi:putative cytochrome c oxidase subunit [Clavispora lusitaniae]|uniref:Cytochrome c oxidase subunit 6, mitochondrial n=2 Tax=Clavispora lusitaniae TaxID=36911 RepID=A0AA91PVH9_CLALS|nr:Cytochrome c oxidase subunit Va family protein [Clavispora lusitaniae]OVF05414.1 putative cytochrome c oxidase subunit [Clavispora lusitaniae]QFZ30140.1 putative cytochrome c oxidase subunit [Clavispora lusitaniae]QFZ35804.1 putative cytochrome c oxidase subunit [Clavispora lusitaniae]QFZ41486.1 putative cytochrome c oxidase subunit [Clavispora lusitaniae]